ncbi:hypothetical protein, partial [Phocaeicola vulgatus]|uniref:hypothetical protein n=1 Tax=Phocaeicola vulgatus TaxID=821 RepID=UPI001C702347
SDLQSCMLNPPGLSGEPCFSPVVKKRHKKRAKVFIKPAHILKNPPPLWGSFHLSRLSCVILSLLYLKKTTLLIPIKLIS